MELKKISRSKSFEMVNGYGLKHWDKFGLEGELAENENPIQAYKELDAMIMQAHKESYPALSVVADNVPVPEVQVKEPETKLTKEERQKAEIASCTDKTVLASYRLIVKKYPNLQETYDNTMKLLTKTD